MNVFLAIKYIQRRLFVRKRYISHLVLMYGPQKNHNRSEVGFEFLFSLHFRDKIEKLKNISWNPMFWKNCYATSTRIWPPALHRPSFFVQYPSLLKCDCLFVWNEIDLLPVLLGVVHKRRRIFFWFFDPFLPHIKIYDDFNDIPLKKTS